jgi:hypothetical protein
MFGLNAFHQPGIFYTMVSAHTLQLNILNTYLQMKLLLPFCFALILLLSACDQNNDQAKQVDKNGSIEVSLSISHIDSLKDLLTTHYTVWRKGVMVREFDKKDTVPSLGEFTTEGENDNGDTKNVNVKKDYEFFVTVK